MKLRKKITISVASAILILTLLPTASAHPGGTDENGGHYDHSAGEYHYHHGYSAHQHYNGECPYDFDDATEPHGNKYTYNPSRTHSPTRPPATPTPTAPPVYSKSSSGSKQAKDPNGWLAIALSILSIALTIYFTSYNSNDTYTSVRAKLFSDAKKAAYTPLTSRVYTPQTLDDTQLRNIGVNAVYKNFIPELCQAIWNCADAIKPPESVLDERARIIEIGKTALNSSYYVSVNTRTDAFHTRSCRYFSYMNHRAHLFDAALLYTPCHLCNRQTLSTLNYFYYVLLAKLKGMPKKEEVLLWTDGFFIS